MPNPRLIAKFKEWANKEAPEVRAQRIKTASKAVDVGVVNFQKIWS